LPLQSISLKLGLSDLQFAALVAAFCLTLGLLPACKKQAGLPTSEAILTETFSSGIAIGTREESARAAKQAANVEYLFLTAEQLLERNLYHERAADKDLLAIIIATDAKGNPTVRGLRAYLAGVGVSQLTLSGSPAAALPPDEVEENFGKPFNVSSGQDARTHLTYYFADPQHPGMALKLTTSHEYDGGMYAMALERVLAPK
jgi:hypothetical protein